LAQEMARSEGLVSLLSVPLSVRERVIGVLNCYTDSEHSFTDEQRTLFLTLANQTALAIENARLVSNAAMVREMHHRIKNNLQTVAMLMRLQLSDASAEVRQELTTSINRVHSIAAVHEVLSERGFRLVDLKAVLERITGVMVDSLTGPETNIIVNVEGQAMLLPSRAATNIALVVNELVQNTIDHAFSGQDQGRVRISLSRAPQELVISVRDDGLGLPQKHTSGLGLEIAKVLIAEQLRGELSFQQRQPGTEVTIRIPRTVETEGF
jgi:two-component sensor histidine kinase